MNNDCAEGCDSSHKHRWEIEPHPDTSDFDVMVTDDDDAALEAAHRAIENAWDNMEPGDEVVVKIRMNRPAVSERKAFLALVHAICDVMTSGGAGVCTRNEKGKSTCNALNCKPYAIAMAQREKLLSTQDTRNGDV